MATYLANLETRRDAVATELAALGATKAGGLPDSDASSVKHEAYKAGLYKELEMLDKAIVAAQQGSDGPVEVITEAYSP